MHGGLVCALLLMLAVGCDGSGAAAPAQQPALELSASAPTPPPVAPDTDAHTEAPPSRATDVVSDRVRHAHGLYFSGPMTRLLGAGGIARKLRRAGLGAAVIDLKDDQGRVLFDTHVEDLRPSRSVLLRDVPALVRDLHAAGIHVIARIVCFNDARLAPAHLDRAVLDTRRARRGRPWISWGTRTPWLDPSHPQNQESLRDLAVEAAALGFDEVKLDYVRFPVDPGTRFAVFPHVAEGERHLEVIRRFVRSIDEAITVPIGVDIFGIAALRTGDPPGLGQSVEHLAPHVEVFSPMLYAAGFPEWRAPSGGDAGASLVFTATERMRARVGSGPVLRPFLQGFPHSDAPFDARTVHAYLRAARNAGADGFLVWNPACDYDVVLEALRGPSAGLVPFPGVD